MSTHTRTKPTPQVEDCAAHILKRHRRALSELAQLFRHELERLNKLRHLPGFPEADYQKFVIEYAQEVTRLVALTEEANKTKPQFDYV